MPNERPLTQAERRQRIAEQDRRWREKGQQEEGGSRAGWNLADDQDQTNTNSTEGKR